MLEVPERVKMIEPPAQTVVVLALIVLFAIISIMVYQSLSEPYSIELSSAEKEAFIKEPANHVLAVIPIKCRACTPEMQRYTVKLPNPPNSAATDMAKQLLILIGTLMTSATSFYFGARVSSTPKEKDESPRVPPPDNGGEEQAPDNKPESMGKTPDEDLPAAEGGHHR